MLPFHKSPRHVLFVLFTDEKVGRVAAFFAEIIR